MHVRSALWTAGAVCRNVHTSPTESGGRSFFPPLDVVLVGFLLVAEVFRCGLEALIFFDEFFTVRAGREAKESRVKGKAVLVHQRSPVGTFGRKAYTTGNNSGRDSMCMRSLVGASVWDRDGDTSHKGFEVSFPFNSLLL